LLVKMQEAGLRIAVATSSEKDDLEKLEAIANIADLVEKETTSNDAEKSKPHPDIFQAALERLKLKSEDAVALGDTPWDIQAAGKAGVKTIAVTSGGWTAEQLGEAGALEVYKDVQELLQNFERSALAQAEVHA
jgi:beta-phosphoglucomutase-like phosphatase (HAD superfamily)